MKPGYEITHVYQRIVSGAVTVMQDNYRPINKVTSYYTTRDTMKTIIDHNTVAIFKIKLKSK